jgi:hypothetical protein
MLRHRLQTSLLPMMTLKPTIHIFLFSIKSYIKELDHNLISPFQVRVNQIVINEAPLMSFPPTAEIPKNAHSIIIEDHNFIIPLHLNGIMSYFPTRRPTKDELEHPEKFPHVIMTYDSPIWDPYDTEFSRIEQKCQDQSDSTLTPSRRYIENVSSNRSEFDTAVAKLSVAETTSVRRNGTVRPDELAKTLENWS